jgi:hypothetical protein
MQQEPRTVTARSCGSAPDLPPWLLLSEKMTVCSMRTGLEGEGTHDMLRQQHFLQP